MSISALIIAKNEEKTIKKCLQSLSWCQEIIVIDDFSSDKTSEIAKKLGAKVFLRKLNNDFSEQRNFGLQKARGDWILFCDADELISPELRNEIQEKIVNVNGINGFYLKRQDKFLGKWLKHGETAQIRLLRLARKGIGRWEGKVHETWQVKGEVENLHSPLIHQREITISEFLTKINNYSSLRAQDLYEKKVKSSWFWIISFPLAKFCQNYLWRLGFLDGKPGLIMALMMSIHSFFVRAKLYLLWQNKGEENPPIPPLKELYKQYG